MDRQELRKLLEKVKEGNLPVSLAMDRLKFLPYEDLGFAKIDTHRALRRGFPEVIFCEGKTVDQIKRIVRRIKRNDIIAVRATRKIFFAIRKVIPGVKYFKDARIVASGPKKGKTSATVLVITAGTADIPVAEEACVTAEVLGNRVRRLYDVGVAGIHRLLDHKEMLSEAGVLIVVAGMDGALPSVVGGLVDIPVIAVPTSVGYGASFGGLSALLTMLNTCSPGVTVVNIDNGFGAGYFASLVNSKREKRI